jgi:hypothetical protein
MTEPPPGIGGTAFSQCGHRGRSDKKQPRLIAKGPVSQTGKGPILRFSPTRIVAVRFCLTARNGTGCSGCPPLTLRGGGPRE